MALRDEDDVREFLQQRSYLHPSADVGIGIRRYQIRHRLAASGQFDGTTQQHMEQSRCGWVDGEDLFANVRSIVGFGAPSRPFRWAPGLTPSGMTPSQAIEVFQAAFEMWESVSPVKFERESSGAPITISCVQGDGPGRVLARAFQAGPIQLDRDESWSLSVPPTGHADLLTVMLHEIGHVLGLGDNDTDPTAIMHGFFGNGPAVIRRTFTATDHALIQVRFGGS